MAVLVQTQFFTFAHRHLLVTEIIHLHSYNRKQKIELIYSIFREFVSQW